MSTKKINWSVNENLDRNELRKRVINKFMEELPGEGTGDLTSKYIYYVEKLSNGDRIYLTRPVPLNNGFDFIIHVENVEFKHISVKMKRHYNNDAPAHKNIFDDLGEKKKEDIQKYTKLLKLIERVFRCEDPSRIMENYDSIEFKNDYSVELLLKVLKWFFIEQDIRYWSYSGRSMLLNGIKSV
jgi:hypothetical protein